MGDNPLCVRAVWFWQLDVSGSSERPNVDELTVFGQLYDCGDSRNGSGYIDVTKSTDAEVVAARKLMDEILADKPVPVVRN